MPLVDRRDERRALDALLEGARVGRSGVLVVRGEPGVGKTALLQHAIESASDLRVLRAVGVESEMELPFAALHQLCLPMLDRLERLPEPQCDALTVTFGLRAGVAPDRFFVGLAALSLLAALAEDRPLLCVIDDAQWLDKASAQTLVFVARRLFAESIAMIFAAREARKELTALPQLVVEGLRAADARELLRSVIAGRLDERVADQIIGETRGNPLALLELPRGVPPARLAGGFGLPRAGSVPAEIEEDFAVRLRALPRDTRRLLLLAAAEPSGDQALVWRAAEKLGLGGSVLEPAELAGLIEEGARMRFRHPLVRSAVYRAASPKQRREVHRALADATGSEVDSDRHAWHLAEATSGQDEDVAAVLVRAAERAQARGGVAAAAAFLARSVALTADPERLAERALAAARATHLAGAPEAALELLATANAGPLDDLGLAEVDMLRAQVSYAQDRGRDAPRLLLRAAKRLEPLDLTLARSTYLEALSAAFYLGRLSGKGWVADVARAALAAPKPDRPRASDLLLDGLATRFVDGYAESAPMLKTALAAVPDEQASGEDGLRWLWFAIQAAVNLWDDQTWDAATTRYVQLARDTGVLPELPLALNGRIASLTFAGGLGTAAALVEEAQSVSEAIDSHVPPYGALILAAWRGRETEATRLIEQTTTEVLARGEAYAVSTAQWARAVLCNGLGRYEDALAAAERATEHSEDLWFFNWGLIELIEAAVRTGKPERAGEALHRLSELTRASGSEWALGVQARSRALLGDGERTETLYHEAIERLRGTRVRVELARAHLLYGEWLRRDRRRVDAREQLRIARELFAAMGVEAFAERAERELLATGERVRRRIVETREMLTTQESQVARLARDGLSNAEIAARLFISPKTVEYHLHKVFTKLGINSRNQLHSALPGEPLAELVV